MSLNLTEFADELLRREAEARAMALVIGERRGLLRAARLVLADAKRPGLTESQRWALIKVAQAIEEQEMRLPRPVGTVSEARRQAEERGEWPREATRRDLAEEDGDGL